MGSLLWVVSALHPAPAEVATWLKSGRERRAGVGGRTTVLGAPNRRRSFPFGAAAVKDAEPSTGHLHHDRQ